MALRAEDGKESSPDEASQENLGLGDLFAERYRIERLLGQGDRKRTYLAEDVKVGDRLVAISVVTAAAAELDPDGTKREGNLLSRVGHHPNIVAFHDSDVVGKTQYLVVQYLSGGTLAELIESSSEPFSETLLLRYGRQLGRGLSHIHRAGVIHRDLSPQNVWLDERREAHIGDFDSAVVIGQADGFRPLTTEAFASPEEQSGGQIDERSDLYSLGGVLIALALGSRRFEDADELRVVRSDLSPALISLLLSLVAESPEERPTNAEDVLHRLDEIRHRKDLHSLISAGEGPGVEFKSSFRYPHGLPLNDLPKARRAELLQEKIPELEKEVLLTIAAFLNADGGTLLVGVQPDGNIVGIEPDLPTLNSKQKDLDEWQIMLSKRVTESLGDSVWATLRLRLEPTDDGTVARIDCPARSSETWLTHSGQEEFYVRQASTSCKIPPSAAARYIRERWPS
jgi:serine/threonine protein kinase